MVTPSERSVENKAGSTTFTVTSNTNLTVVKDVSWLTVSLESDSGNGTITVTYIDNPEIVMRSGKAILIGGGITDTVLVQQDSKKFLTVFPIETNLSYRSG